MIFKDRWEVINIDIIKKNKNWVDKVASSYFRNGQLNPPFSVIYFKGEVL